jgi:hypothetical protein
MRYYIRKPSGAIMTREEFKKAVFGWASIGGNYWLEARCADYFAAQLGDGYRVVVAEAQPPDYETRYFIRKPNGMLIADRDEAREYYPFVHHYNPNVWAGGFLICDHVEGIARRMGKGFAVVPREMLTGRDS